MATARLLVVAALAGAAESYNVLVTGAAGFVGMHTSIKLCQNGHTVVGMDNINDYYDIRLKHLRIEEARSKGVSFVKGDVCDGELLAKLFADHKINRVIHLAAQAGVRYSLDHPLAYVKNNVECFVTMLETLKNTGIPLTYASSSSVYGLNTKVPFAEDDEINNPASLYAATKRMNEQTAITYKNLYNQSSIGLRFFTVYGPWGRPDMAAWKFVSKVSEGNPIQVFNNGNMERDFTYIDDIVAGVVATLDRYPEDKCEVYNLGGNHPVRLMKFIKEIGQALQIEPKLEMLPMQKGDVPRTYANIDKSKKNLQYSPETPVKAGIKHFVEWYRWYVKQLERSPQR